MADDSVYRGGLKPEVAAARLFQATFRRMEIDGAIAQLEKQCSVQVKNRSLLVCEGPHGCAVVNGKNAKLYAATDKKVLLAESDHVRHQVAVWVGLTWAANGPDSVPFD